MQPVAYNLAGTRLPVARIRRNGTKRIKSLSVNGLLKKEPMNSPYPILRLGLGSATVPVAAVNACQASVVSLK